MFSLPFWNRRKVTNTQPDNGFIGRAVGEVFHPGADIYAPVERATNPAIMVTGTGYIPRFNLNPVQPPPLRAVMVVGTGGLNGPQAGALFFAPLVDPNSLNPSEPSE